MQIKILVKYNYKFIRMAKSRALTTPNAEEDVKQEKLSFITGRNAKW